MKFTITATLIALAMALAAQASKADTFTVGDCSKPITALQALQAAAQGSRIYRCEEFQLKAGKNSIRLAKVKATKQTTELPKK